MIRSRRSRNNNGFGSAPRRRPDGRWQINISVADDMNRTRRLSVYGRSRAEVVAAAHAKQAECNAGRRPAGYVPTFGELASEYLQRQESTCKPTTVARTRSLLRNHIEKEWASVRVDVADRRAVQSWLDRKADTGLARDTVNGLRYLMSHLVGMAVGDGVIPRNYATTRRSDGGTHLPAVYGSTPRKSKGRALRADEVEQLKHTELVDATGKPSRYKLPIRLLLATGMRRGEVLGLRWGDVDFDLGTISVRQQLVSAGGRCMVQPTLKSSAGRRTLKPLDPELIGLLAEWHEAQAAELAASSRELPATDLVFTTAQGRPLDPRNLNRACTSLARRAGVLDAAGRPDFNPHDARSTAVTRLLEQGFEPMRIARHVGHRNLAVTLGPYAQLRRDDIDEDLAARARL